MNDAHALGPEKPIPSPPAPAVEEWRPLLPTGFSLVLGGVLAAVGAQLLVTASAFRELYEAAGLVLPWIVKNLVAFPRLLPLTILAVALFALAAGRLPHPRAKWLSAARRVCMAGLICVAGYACLLAYMLPATLTLVQRSLQQ